MYQAAIMIYVAKKFKRAIEWLIRGKDGRVYVAQPPNIPIISWFLFMVAASFTPSPLKLSFSHLSIAFLAIWCYLEITQGSSPFRRLLGMVVGIAVLYHFFQ